MYKSPIEIMHDELKMEMEGEVLKAVQRVGVNVDKEELIKALKYDRNQYKKGYEAGLSACKWIPCSERLPEVQKDCLVTAKYSGFMGMYGTWVKTGYLNSKWAWNGDCFGGEVVAWMPLPEPYKGE